MDSKVSYSRRCEALSNPGLAQGTIQLSRYGLSKCRRTTTVRLDLVPFHQSFPKHLQEHLEARIPPHLDIKIQTSLYPTYKSVKPIAYATKNFLEW